MKLANYHFLVALSFSLLFVVSSCTKKTAVEKTTPVVKEVVEAVTKSEMPPIIDREIFFGNPEIAGAQLSPDGKYMTFIKPYNEIRNIWIKERFKRYV